MVHSSVGGSGSPDPRHHHGSSGDGGGQHPQGSAGNNAQLMHWMSAVMAEHINHHTAADGVHYVWNGGSGAAVEVCYHHPHPLSFDIII
jgi:hypothetical protein